MKQIILSKTIFELPLSVDDGPLSDRNWHKFYFPLAPSYKIHIFFVNSSSKYGLGASRYHDICHEFESQKILQKLKEI